MIPETRAGCASDDLKFRKRKIPVTYEVSLKSICLGVMIANKAAKSL